MAESLQKYVFDGEAGKIALELKNVIASAGFLFEQKLVEVLAPIMILVVLVFESLSLLLCLPSV